MKHSKENAAKNLGVQRAESKATPELDAAPSFTPGPWAVADSFMIVARAITGRAGMFTLPIRQPSQT